MRFVLVLAVMFIWVESFAQSSVNIGYGNPPGSMIGVNYLYFFHPWALELGLGYVATEGLSSSGDAGETRQNGAFSMNGKYLFGSGLFIPYAQVGAGIGSGPIFGRNGGKAVGYVDFYEGFGLMIKDSAFYFYTSFNFKNLFQTQFFQIGLGFLL